MIVTATIAILSALTLAAARAAQARRLQAVKVAARTRRRG